MRYDECWECNKIHNYSFLITQEFQDTSPLLCKWTSIEEMHKYPGLPDCCSSSCNISVIVLHSCRTIPTNLSNSKQYSFIISPFHRSEVQGGLSSVLCLASHRLKSKFWPSELLLELWKESFQAYSGCYWNSIPYSNNTEVTISLLAVSWEPLLHLLRAIHIFSLGPSPSSKTGLCLKPFPCFKSFWVSLQTPARENSWLLRTMWLDQAHIT